MIPIKNKKKSLEATVEEMRSFSFGYIEKYAPSKQQLKTYLLKKYLKTKIPNVNKSQINDLINVVLEDLKKSLKGNEIINSDEPIEEKIDDPKTVIKSPIVGTAYLSPEPGSKPFVSVGKKIKKGETLLIVEAMKTMNHVPSTTDGVVKKVCVEDGQPVEFGQTIIILE